METSIQNYYEEYKKLGMKKNLSGRKALELVKQNGYDLQYVNENIFTKSNI